MILYEGVILKPVKFLPNTIDVSSSVLVSSVVSSLDGHDVIRLIVCLAMAFELVVEKNTSKKPKNRKSEKSAFLYEEGIA